LLGAFWPLASFSASPCPDRYQDTIEEAAGRFLPGVDWRLWKAQLCAESRLEPDAVSPVGAQGIAQFMPATWREIAPAAGVGAASARQVRPAALAGAYYMARLRRGWSSPRPEADRHSLAMASYNAGFGHLLTAQRRCGGSVLYAEIITCLPEVTGEHSRETIGYVRRIWRLYTVEVVGP